MKLKFLLSFILIGFLSFSNAQSIDELKAMQADKAAVAADFQAKAGAAQAEVNALQAEIDKLSGWRKGFSGMLGFDWNKSNGWVANPNPDASSSSLNIDLNAYALMDKEKVFWHNKGFVTKSWSDVDLSSADSGADDDNLFDNGTKDILNISSLGGYKISDNFALSGLGEINTSVENFLSPGTFDIGVGATWLPSSNLTVVIHPFNYHIAFSGIDNVDSEGSVGAKVRADYFQDFNIGGKTVKWTSTLTTFAPYSKAEEGEPKLFNYQWINMLNFEVWNGIGVGVGWGLRNSEFESDDVQSYTALGLSYGF
ncbi:MAG: DUF3078 domain-containing protein [Saprospiraceae bacterium]|nr:DUF3078 domain-containing protein [Bacteroidia bacterium]NNE16547.1 DUF3078 domain-containing protein [Saprospiraceae bacterium]